MTLKSYVWGMWLVTLLSVGALVLVIIYVDPDSAGMAGRVIFFSVTFFALGGVFNLLLLRLRKNITTLETAFHNVGMSFRQGMLLGLLSAGILILQGARVLVWWSGLLLVILIFLIELYFLSRSAKR